MISSMSYSGMCYLEDLRSKWPKSKIEAVQEQKNKDIPGSICLDNLERRAFFLNG